MYILTGTLQLRTNRTVFLRPSREVTIFVTHKPRFVMEKYFDVRERLYLNQYLSSLRKMHRIHRPAIQRKGCWWVHSWVYRHNLNRYNLLVSYCSKRFGYTARERGNCTEGLRDTKVSERKGWATHYGSLIIIRFCFKLVPKHSKRLLRNCSMHIVLLSGNQKKWQNANFTAPVDSSC